MHKGASLDVNPILGFENSKWRIQYEGRMFKNSTYSLSNHCLRVFVVADFESVAFSRHQNGGSNVDDKFSKSDSIRLKFIIQRFLVLLLTNLGLEIRKILRTSVCRQNSLVFF